MTVYRVFNVVIGGVLRIGRRRHKGSIHQMPRRDLERWTDSGKEQTCEVPGRVLLGWLLSGP